MKRVFLGMVMLVPSLLLAQGEKQLTLQPRTTQVFRIRYASPSQVQHLLEGMGGLSVSSDNVLNLVVISGDAPRVEAAGQMVKEIDVSPAAANVQKNIELTLYAIGGFNDSRPQISMPAELDPVLKQLKGIFPYRTYQLLDTMLLRSREGRRAENHGSIRGISADQAIEIPGSYQVVGTSSLDPADKRLLHIDHFLFEANFQVKGPNNNGTTYATSGVIINSDFDVREGQKVVVGKADMQGEDSAMFVVVSARVVE